MRVLLILAALVGFEAHAQTACPAAPQTPSRNTASLSWVRPTQNADGSALAANVPLTYTLYRRVGQTDTAVCTTNAVTAGQLNLAVGEHCWVVTAKTATSAESSKSNAACKTVVDPTPGAPQSLTVAADATAWTIVQSRDRVALVAVGTVAPGTQCDANQRVLDKFVVPRSAVSFAGSVQPEVVLASCG